MNTSQVGVMLVAGAFILLSITLDKYLHKNNVAKNIRKKVSIIVMIFGVVLMIATFLVLLQYS